MCFPVNFVKLLRTLFFKEHLWWLLLALLPFLALHALISNLTYTKKKLLQKINNAKQETQNKSFLHISYKFLQNIESLRKI